MSTPKQEKLSWRRERFCQLFTTEKEFFGNGVQTYIEVYNPDMSKSNWYKTACSSASQILSNIKVSDRIAELLEEGMFNDSNVNKQHSYLITQQEDKKTKMKAISEFYKLKGKYQPDKLDVLSGGKTIKSFNFVTPDGRNNSDNKTST